ncbi:MAG: hypothetical protein RIU67_589 [Actinomycetota bacterium]|jgi:DNA recombination protein RmuC
MNIVLSIAVVVLAGVVVVLALRGRTPATPITTAPTSPPIDPTAITADVSRTVSDALSQALRALDERARLDRQEAIKLASDMVTEKGGEQIGARASLIEKGLKEVQDQMGSRLVEMDKAIKELASRNNTQYDKMGEAVAALTTRTENLNRVLSNSQARGQWGERLAEDMLRAAGFIEGINYDKQTIIDGGGRPDYRFTIPPDRVLYMDVKFPLDKYAEYVAATSDSARAAAQDAFVKAVRSHADILAKRDYIDKSTDNTVDYVLMFVPNESISGFVHESDPHLIDFALERKVVLCSPLTLYAFLVVIRQAADAFHTEKTATQIMQFVNLFQKEWEKYTAAVDEVEKLFHKFGASLESINTGGTRFRMLGAQVKKIEKLRTKQGIPELPLPSDDEFIDADEADE